MTDYVLVKTYPVDEYDVPDEIGYGSLTLPLTIGSAGQVLMADAAGTLEWVTPTYYIEIGGHRFTAEQAGIAMKHVPYVLAFSTLITLVVLIAVMRWMAKNWR